MPSFSMPDPVATWFFIAVAWQVLVARWAYKAGVRAARKERKDEKD